MITGKIPVNVLKRSVLKEIKLHKDEIAKGAGVGTDCAFFVPDKNSAVALCSDIALPKLKDGYVYSIYKVAANLAAAGAIPEAILVNLLLPNETEEEQIKEIMKGIQETVDLLQMSVAGGHTEVSPTVSEAVITLSGIGQKCPEYDTEQKLLPGMDLVVTKWVGLEGTIILAREGKESLLTRYPERMIREAVDFMKYLSVLPEAAYAVKSGVCRIHDISRGGIFGALWEMVASAGVGLDIDLKKIPIRQETIEICEHFSLNPYEMISGGSLLIATDDGEALVRGLEQIGVESVIIGNITSSNDKVIRNGEDIRFLDRPKQDEIYTFLTGGN